MSNTSLKKQVARCFSKASTHYDQAAALQQEISSRLQEKLDYLKFQPQHILELGMGTGKHLLQLAKRYPKAQCTGIDIAFDMVKFAKTQKKWRQKVTYICADAEHIPLPENSVDFIFSNCAFQWCQDLARLFHECQRILKPNGLLLFSTFGPSTLIELKEAYKQIDDYQHVNSFVDMHIIGDILYQKGFQQPVMEMEKITLEYPSLLSLLKELKALGANHVTDNAKKGLSTPRQISRLEQHYPQKEQCFPATFEVLYGLAWKAENHQSTTDKTVYQISTQSIKTMI